VRLAPRASLAGGVWLAAAAAAGGTTLTARDAVRETLARDPKVAQAAGAGRRAPGPEPGSSPALRTAPPSSTPRLDYQRPGLAGEVLKTSASGGSSSTWSTGSSPTRRADLELRLREQNALSDGQQPALRPLRGAAGRHCGVSQTEVRIDPRRRHRGEPPGRGLPLPGHRQRLRSVARDRHRRPCSDECKADPGVRQAVRTSRSSRCGRCSSSRNLEGLGTPLETMAHESRALLRDQARIALRLSGWSPTAPATRASASEGCPRSTSLIDFTTQVGYRQRCATASASPPRSSSGRPRRTSPASCASSPFGDSEKSNLFSSTARLTFDLPLGKNRA